MQQLLLGAALRKRLLLVRVARLLGAAARVGGGVRRRGNCKVNAGPPKKREGGINIARKKCTSELIESMYLCATLCLTWRHVGEGGVDDGELPPKKGRKKEKENNRK